MITLILILSILNFIGLLIAAIIYFKKNYVIYSKEVADEMANYYMEHHDEEGNEIARELAGGTGTPYYGFFQEYLDEGDDEPDEEE